MENKAVGICYECSTNKGDSSKKPVYRCDLCGKWFCEPHCTPKFPYIVDWETQFNVQGNPAVKSTFHSEYGRQDGHADFIYLRKMTEALEMDKQRQNQLIQQGIDRMAKANSLRKKEINETIQKNLSSWFKRKTYENKCHNKFTVPREVYSNKNYRDRLESANSLQEVDRIVLDYYGNRTIERQPTKKVINNKKWWEGDAELTKIYEDEEFRKRIDECQTIEERNAIIKEYYESHFGKSGDKVNS